MNKGQQIKFAKRKHRKQLKRNAKNKIGRQHRMEARIMMQQIRKAHADVPEDILNQVLGQPTLAK